MGTTVNGTISGSGYATVGPFNAVAFLTINNIGPDPGPLTVSWGGVAPPNSILVSGSVTVNAVEDNTGLWPLVANTGLTIMGPLDQQFSVYYA